MEGGFATTYPNKFHFGIYFGQKEVFEAGVFDLFPGVAVDVPARATVVADSLDEYDDLVALLLAHRVDESDTGVWLTHAIATAALRNNHLWQDLGLPNRAVLSRLMRENFPALAARNVGDMKWKKFFYRQLCEQAEVLICKSPNCAVCSDYSLCFAPN